MSNFPHDILNGFGAGDSFPLALSQELEDLEQYHSSQFETSEYQTTLPGFNALLSPPLVDYNQVYGQAYDQAYDQPYNEVYGSGTYLPPSLSQEHSTTRSYSDFSDPLPINSEIELTPPSDHQSPVLQPTDSEKCYGSICGIRICFADDERYQYVVGTLTADPYVCICPLSFNKDRCKLYGPNNTGGVVATLSKKDFARLDRLHRDFDLRFDAVITEQHLNGMARQNLAISVDINVYGKQSCMDDAADALAAATYFLQDPNWKPEDMDYDNPQILELPEFEDTASLIDEELVQGLFSSSSSRQLARFVKSHGIDFGEVFDDFARHEYLSQAAIDARIRTELLPYQKIGVEFILERESTSTEPEHTLWDQEYQDDDDEVIWRHSITGATSDTPRQMLGGILADEMGLGKSVMMLSAIMASSNDAEVYVRSKMSGYSSGEQNIIAAKSTLLIVPSALLIDNWIAEIDTHIYPGSISHYKYHGHRRKIQGSDLVQNDIVLTTYGTVAVELSRPQKLLFGIDWYRVVLDEAHVIRNSSTHNFRAVHSLRSQIRWCMSGTPIQNTIDDLATQIRFLRVPFLEEPAQFRRHVSHKIQLSKSNTTRDFQNLRTLLRSICLRRNKNVLPMSSYEEETCEVRFDARERAEYARLEKVCFDAHDMMVTGDMTQRNHSIVLRVILRLRLLCNNGPAKLPSGIPFLEEDSDDNFALLQQSDSAVCHFCRRDILSVASTDDPESAKITPCSALVCFECLDKYSVRWEMGLCPICNGEHEGSRADSDHTIITPVDQDMLDVSSIVPTVYPTKLLKLCENIQAEVANHKSIVFSFWKRTLDIVCQLFKEQNIPYLRLDGDVPYSRRKDIISQFGRSDQGMILLMTLSIGAVGLNNLSVASHIHILEPQWNPQVEAQAIGRVIRLGQERPVRIIRYLVKGTVEKSIQDRQLQKLRLSRAGVHDEGDDEDDRPMAVLLRDLIHPNEDSNP